MLVCGFGTLRPMFFWFGPSLEELNPTLEDFSALLGFGPNAALATPTVSPSEGCLT